MNFTKTKNFKKIASLFVAVIFLCNTILPNACFAAEAFGLPGPAQFVNLSGAYSFPVLKGLKFDPNKPLTMKFLIDTGNQRKVSKEEAACLIRYFLAGLTISPENFWVNLSPYEKDRIIPDILAQTNVGQDLLGQDYVLKQISASLTYPESEIGRDFWTKAYQAVLKIAKTTNIPVNTFNKIWIVPDKSMIHENNNTAVVAEASLKAMLEEDYLSLNNNLAKIQKEISQRNTHDAQRTTHDLIQEINKASSNVMRDFILPKINQDINSGKNFATLRQIYHSLILAGWFKKKFKESLYSNYIDKGKVKGIDLSDKNAKEKVYNLYLNAFKKGLYNYIKTEQEPASRKQIKRRYYSGGFDLKRAITNSPIIEVSSSAISNEITKLTEVDTTVNINNKQITTSPIEEKIKKIIADPTISDKISLPDLVKTYRSNIAWAIDRLDQSTAGVRGRTSVTFEPDPERPGYIRDIKRNDILEGNQLNAAAIIFYAQVYAEYLKQHNLASAFVSGDERHFSSEYTKLITRVLVGNGIRVFRDLDGQSTATPGISYMAHHFKDINTGIIVTASHNPINQNGIKSVTFYGGVDTDDKSDALAEIAKNLYKQASENVGVIKFGSLNNAKLIEEVDVKAIYYKEYIRRLFSPASFVTTLLTAYNKNRSRYIFDGLGGVGGKTIKYYLNEIFGNNSWQGIVEILNDEPDPNILGILKPDPSDPSTLELSGALKELASDDCFRVSVTADMDADRTGPAVIIPEKDVEKARKFGLFVSEMESAGKKVYIVRFTPNQIFTLIAYERILQVFESRLGTRDVGEIKKAIVEGKIDPKKIHLIMSVPTSRIMSTLAEFFGLTVHFTAVGFKNLGYTAKEIEEKDPEATVIMLAEESGGATIGPISGRDAKGSGIAKDKDTAILALALYETAAKLSLDDKNLLDLYAEMAQDLGGLFYYSRVDAKLPNEKTAESTDPEIIKKANEAKQEVIKKFMSLEAPENTKNLVEIFGKSENEIKAITDSVVPNTYIFIKEDEEWLVIEPTARKIEFKTGERLEIFHLSESAGGGPVITFYDKTGKLLFWTLIRPSGTESMVRVYMEIFEPFDNPQPEHLYTYFTKLFEYIGLDKYEIKENGPNYYAAHVEDTRKKFITSSSLKKLFPMPAALPVDQRKGGIDLEKMDIPVSSSSSSVNVPFFKGCIESLTFEIVGISEPNTALNTSPKKEELAYAR